jgi:hypothetical protein
MLTDLAEVEDALRNERDRPRKVRAAYLAKSPGTGPHVADEARGPIGYPHPRRSPTCFWEIEMANCG